MKRKRRKMTPAQLKRHRERGKAWYKANRAKMIEWRRAYYRKNIAVLRKANLGSYIRHRQERIAGVRRWHKRHRAEVIAYYKRRTWVIQQLIKFARETGLWQQVEAKYGKRSIRQAKPRPVQAARPGKQLRRRKGASLGHRARRAG